MPADRAHFRASPKVRIRGVAQMDGAVSNPFRRASTFKLPCTKQLIKLSTFSVFKLSRREKTSPSPRVMAHARVWPCPGGRDEVRIQTMSDHTCPSRSQAQWRASSRQRSPSRHGCRTTHGVTMSRVCQGRRRPTCPWRRRLLQLWTHLLRLARSRLSTPSKQVPVIYYTACRGGGHDGRAAEVSPSTPLRSLRSLLNQICSKFWTNIARNLRAKSRLLLRSARSARVCSRGWTATVLMVWPNNYKESSASSGMSRWNAFFLSFFLFS